MSDYNSAYAYVAALTGRDPDTVSMSFRAIHDTDDAVPAQKFEGTIAQLWSTLCSWNDNGYGIFANINEMDGQGHLLVNVRSIRAHIIDLDNVSAQQNYELACKSQPAPAFAVQSSPGRYHVYWLVQSYRDNDYYQTIQRKLRQVFDGDRSVIDPTRVLRLPGTHNHKRGTADLVTCWSLSGFGTWHPVTDLADALAHVNVIETGHGGRKPIGDPSMAAPSLDYIVKALSFLDPNLMDRAEWISTTAAIKQAAWSLGDPNTILKIWSDWCAQYDADNVGENHKQWNSIKETEIGWNYLRRKIPALQASILFTDSPHTMTTDQTGQGTPGGAVPPMPVTDAPNDDDYVSEFMDIVEQRQFFRDCVFITSLGAMLVANGRFLNSSQFNGAMGGKNFILNGNGKTTNEAWQAATRCTLHQVPKVDHTRFIPHMAHRELVTDDLGRSGINMYRPAIIKRAQGDASRFIWHMQQLLPDPKDLKMVMDFLAHNAKFPGFKIPWAPVIQSTEGAGKGLLKAAMTNVMGRSYVYFPNAKELTHSGSQFNAWMRHKLFILADEIKVDDRRDLIEVLKPMISEELIEIQGKGADQGLEDNFGNWMFFTNWRDAIPINRNGRRFAILYSALQTNDDLIQRQMGEHYFKELYRWIKNEGGPIVSDYLLNYPIEYGEIPMRAPDTSSTAAAIEMSRSPLERLIMDCVDEKLPGFIGGWVSVQSVIKRAKAQGTTRTITPQTVQTVLEQLGYIANGRAARAYMQEDREVRSYLYRIGGVGDVNEFGRLQGWE